MQSTMMRVILLMAVPAILCLWLPVTALSADAVDKTVTAKPAIQKPAPGSQINWKNPLAEGLVSAVPLNEGTGNAFYDAVTKENYTAKSLAGTPKDGLPPAWITPLVTPDYPWIGPAISNNNATAQSIQSTLKNAQFIDNVKTGYSYAVLVQPLDDKIFGRIMDGTGAAVITMYLNIPKGREGLVDTTWRGADGVAINPTAKFKVNEWILVFCTVQDGLGVMYINGKEVAWNTHVDLAKSWARQTGQLVYNATGNGGMMCNANFSSWWVWNNRVLTAQEAADMYADPWAMFASRQPSITANPVNQTGTTGTNPITSNNLVSTPIAAPAWVDNSGPAASRLQFNAPTFIVEESMAAKITVTRTGDSKGIVKVDYCAFTGGFDTAFAVKPGKPETNDGLSGDYVPVRSRIRNLGVNPLGWPYNIAAAGTLVFNDGETSKSFTITTLPHKVPTGDITLSMVLRNPQGPAALGTPADARFIITDKNAPAAGVLQFSSPLNHARGITGTKTITVTRTGGSTGAISVAYATSEADVIYYNEKTLKTSKVAVPMAIAGVEYTQVAGVLKWADGDTAPKTFTVPTLANKSTGIKNVGLTLSNPTGEAVLGTCKSADLYLMFPAPHPTGEYRICNRNGFSHMPKDSVIHGVTGGPITVRLPANTPVARGVLFPTSAVQANTLCQMRGFALVTSYCETPYEMDDPVQNGYLEDILNQVAAATFHPEIANAPFAVESNSSGGGGCFWSLSYPDRALGFVAISGGHLKNSGPYVNDPYEKFFSHSPMTEGARSVPGIFMNGELDRTLDPGTKLTRNVLIESYFTSLRSQGGLVVFANDWNKGHTCGGQSQEMEWYYLDQVIKMRNPLGLVPGVNPGERVPLRKLTENDGWLGEKPNLDRALTSSFLAIGPATKYPGDPKILTSWLPSEGVANAYRAWTSLNLPLAADVPFQTPLMITAPTANQILTAGKITITVDPRTFANIKLMECFDDTGAKVGQLNAAPWNFTATMPVGVHAVSIVATDDNDKK